MDVERLEDAVDQARLKMWTENGVQLGTGFTAPFTEYLAEALGIGQPTADGPQPATEIVAAPSIEAEIAQNMDEPNYDLHDFRSDRGGVNCIECDMTRENGNHTGLED